MQIATFSLAMSTKAGIYNHLCKCVLIRTTGVSNFSTTLAQQVTYDCFWENCWVWYNNKVANILHVVLDYEIILCDNFKVWKSRR